MCTLCNNCPDIYTICHKLTYRFKVMVSNNCLPSPLSVSKMQILHEQELQILYIITIVAAL